MTEFQITHRTETELAAAEAHLRASPADAGTLALVLRRPAVEEREVLDVARLTYKDGVEGDTWNQRGSRRTDDGGPHPDMQLNLMNVRFARLVAGDEARVPLAGDQLYVDLDLSDDNLPAGTRLAIGTAVIEVTDQPHTGCAKFAQRFGIEAQKFVTSPLGTELHLRGINAKVVTEGEIRPGDTITKVA